MKNWPTDVGTLRFDFAASMVETLRQYVDAEPEKGTALRLLKGLESMYAGLLKIEQELSAKRKKHDPENKKSIATALKEWKDRHNDTLEDIEVFKKDFEPYREDIEKLYQTTYSLRKLLSILGTIEDRMTFIGRVG
jgi:hypothetical protein